jgi:hypothetical protein
VPHVNSGPVRDDPSCRFGGVSVGDLDDLQPSTGSNEMAADVFALHLWIINTPESVTSKLSNTP